MRAPSSFLVSAAIFGLTSLGEGAQASGAISADALEWRPAPELLPPGAEIAALIGDPSSSRPFVMRVRARQGYATPIHSRPSQETITIVSGALRYGQGPSVNRARETVLRAGDFYVTLAGESRWLIVDEDVVAQVTGVGPWTFDLPKDPPG